MALVAWYPLVNDGKNYAGSSAQDLNPTFSNNGIFGKCIDTTSNYAEFNSNFKRTDGWNFLTHSVSMSCWIKVNYTTLNNYFKTTGLSKAISSSTSPTGNIIGYSSYGGLCIAYATNTMYSNKTLTSDMTYFRAMGAMRGSTSYNTSAFTIPTDKWTQLTLVYDHTAGKLALYANGSLVNSTTANASGYSTDPTFRINGALVYGGNGPGLSIPAQFSDVRLYDHALSKKEVKELYQQPIISYNFEKLEPVFGANILANQKTTMESLTASVSGPTAPDYGTMKFTTSGAGSTRLSIPQSLLTGGTVYRVSCNVKCPSGMTFDLNDWCDNGTIANKVIRKIDTDTYKLSMDVSRASYDRTYRFFDWNASGAGEYLITEFRMLPIAGYKLNDNSGFGYDATVSGVTLETTNAKVTRGKHSGFFDGVHDYCEFSNPKSDIVSSDFSIAFSVLPGSNGKRSVFLGDHQLTNGVSFNIERNTSNQLRVYVGGSPDLPIADCTIKADSWSHIIITYNKAAKTLKIYKNGSCVYTNTNLNITLSKTAGSAFRLGRDSRDGTAATVTSETPYYGHMGYFEIYPITLSENTCLEMHKTRAQIARDGSLFIDNLNETGTIPTDSAVFDYKMNCNPNGISEFDMKNKFDGNVYFEPDGSSWVRISHHNNPGSTNLFASGNDFVNSVYLDENRWFNGEVCNHLNKWELMIKQKTTSSAAESKYRWVQPKNPMTAAFADVDAADVSQVGGSTISIPSLYQQVSYIQTDGTAFINTGFNTTDTYQIDCDMEIAGTVKSNYWFGQQQANGSMMYNGLYSTTALEFNWKTVSRTSSNRCTMQQTVSGANTIIVMNGVESTVATGTNGVAGDFYIFACNGGSRPYASPMKLYSFRIHQGTTNIRDFVPCYRKSDNVIGLYDRVTGKFYTNANSSGSFSKGMNVAKGDYVTTSYGGLYKNGSNTYLCGNNGTSGNWWGAVGSWTTHNSGIPAWNGEVVTTGYSDLYVRIDNGAIKDDAGTNFKSFNKGAVYAKHIIEY